MAGSNFFVAFRALPPDGRRAIRAVYGFCRRADDAVDEAGTSSEANAALRRVAEQLDDSFAGARGDADADELSWAVERFDLPRGPFDDLIEGLSWDIERRRYADTDELREYCLRVASTVGLLCVRIFGCRNGDCDGYARELGIAMQWTNILRDVGEDLKRGRIYLTEAAMRRNRLTEEDLRNADPDARLRLAALIREEAAYARSRYAVAAGLLPKDARSRVVAGEIMAAVYKALLGRIERAGDVVLDSRVAISGLRRAWIASRLLVRRRS
jgi:phytoene synthase